MYVTVGILAKIEYIIFIVPALNCSIYMIPYIFKIWLLAFTWFLPIWAFIRGLFLLGFTYLPLAFIMFWSRLNPFDFDERGRLHWLHCVHRFDRGFLIGIHLVFTYLGFYLGLSLMAFIMSFIHSFHHVILPFLVSLMSAVAFIESTARIVLITALSIYLWWARSPSLEVLRASFWSRHLSCHSSIRFITPFIHYAFDERGRLHW